MIFEIISGGEKTDWVGKEWAGLFFPRGKNGPAHSFPGEKTDWGEIPASYWSFSELFYFIFFVPPTLNLKKKSRKSTNKKILALSCLINMNIEAKK